MSDINIVINDSTENITVNVDSNSPNLQQFYNTLQNINLLYSLSSKAIETAEEMDTLQESLSSAWQETYEVVNTGIVDGGFF